MDFTGGNQCFVRGRKVIGVDNYLMPQNVTIAGACKIEIAVVCQVDDGGFVCRGLIAEL